MLMEERSGLGGDVDLTVRTRLGSGGSYTHLMKVQLENTNARRAPGGYGGQADLPGIDDETAGASTVSVNWDKSMGTEDMGW
jgi:hypothetical protein